VFEPGHAPAVVVAQLLQPTNRLSEAGPLMRRMVDIFLKFTVATGHPHPHLNAALGNFGAEKVPGTVESPPKAFEGW
jgi:hypothetical protein